MFSNGLLHLLNFQFASSCMQTRPERQRVCRVEPSIRDRDQKQMLEDLQSCVNGGTNGGATEGTNRRRVSRACRYSKRQEAIANIRH